MLRIFWTIALKRLFHRRPIRNKPWDGRFVPAFEPLADRITPAITAFFQPSPGFLNVYGDALDNTITISRDAAGKILVNGGAVPIRTGTATVANTVSIQVFGLAGNDTISLDETNGALPRSFLYGGDGNDVLIGGSGTDSLFGQAGNDTITGGRGHDVAQLGTGDDTFVWNPGDGSDTVEGQDGFDRMQFNGANIAEKIDIAANGNRVRFTRDIASVTMDLNGVEAIDVNAKGGADQITIGDLSGTD